MRQNARLATNHGSCEKGKGVVTHQSAMPTISYFYGIAIRIYFSEHPPPHFHALYGEHVAQIEIASGKVIGGRLPRRALALVSKWRMLHVEDLMEDWRLAQDRKRLKSIEPLE